MNVARGLLDAHPIAQAVTPKSPSGARTDLREWRTSQFFQGMAVGVLTPVLATEGEWDGCDVYVKPAPGSIKNYNTLPNAIYRVLVFATVEGVGTTLIASGIVSPGHMNRSTNTVAKVLAVQARGVRCRYEVFVAYLGITPITPAEQPVQFSLVASNDLAAPDPFVGVSRASYQVIETVAQSLPEASATFNADDTPFGFWEIVSVVASNSNAAARSLLLFDLGHAGPAGNAIPQLSFEVPPNETKEFRGPFGMRFGGFGLRAGVSSDSTKYVAAAAGDLAYQVFLR